jgi:hypothetical protein
LDSDDELLPDAIEKILIAWHSIPVNEYSRFWCISGREENAATGEMVGKPYPEDINNLRGRKQRKAILKYKGEKHCCRKVPILTQYKFPVYPDTKFVTENVVWDKINKKYDQYCVNDIYGKYYIGMEGSLSTDSPHRASKFRSDYYRDLHVMNDLLDEFFWGRRVAICLIDLPRKAILTNTPIVSVFNDLKGNKRKLLLLLLYPVSLLVILVRDVLKIV